jgi:hypothetical protein
MLAAAGDIDNHEISRNALADVTHFQHRS